MVSLATSIYLQNHGRFGSEHPLLVYCLYLVTGLLLLFTLVQFKFIQHLLGVQPIETNETQPSDSSNRGNAAGRDVVGSSVSHQTGDIIGTDAIREKFEHERALLAYQRPAPPLPAIPVFSSYPRFIDAEYGGGMWAKLNEPRRFSNKMAVCFFENPPGTDDRAGIAVRQVEARLKFQAGALEPPPVNTAYWLEEEANQISILAGHHVAVIIGNFEGMERFITYENKWSHPNSSGFGGWACSPGMHVRLSSEKLIVEITLVETRNQRTVARATVEMDATTCAIRKIEL